MWNVKRWDVGIDDVKRVVGECHSYSEVLRKVGMRVHSLNIKRLKEMLRDNGIDVSNLVGCHYAMTKRMKDGKRLLSDFLVEQSGCARVHVKARLIEEGILSERCSICGNRPEWMGKPLPLVLDHINGINNDYRLPNLRLVCPNCNSQLPTTAGKNRKRKEERKCPGCGKRVTQYKTSGWCRKCVQKGKRIPLPDRDDVRRVVASGGIKAAMVKYNRSRTAIYRWIGNEHDSDGREDACTEQRLEANQCSSGVQGGNEGLQRTGTLS